MHWQVALGRREVLRHRVTGNGTLVLKDVETVLKQKACCRRRIIRCKIIQHNAQVVAALPRLFDGLRVAEEFRSTAGEHKATHGGVAAPPSLAA